MAEEGKVKMKKQMREELESYKRDGEAKSDLVHISRQVFPCSDSWVCCCHLSTAVEIFLAM